MKKQKLIDAIVKEPLGGAHSDRKGTFITVASAIEKAYNQLKDLSPKELTTKRMDKYANMGVYKD